MTVKKWGLLMKFWKACTCGKVSGLLYGLWMSSNDKPDVVLCNECFNKKVRFTNK